MAPVVDCQEPWSPSKGPHDEPELLARCIFRNKTTLLFRNLREEAAFTSQLWRQRSTHRTVLFAVMMVHGAVSYLVFDMMIFQHAGAVTFPAIHLGAMVEVGHRMGEVQGPCRRHGCSG